ncbi:MAG TPA: tripartite tricarboxylate transporter TctB family protein [Anaerolineae bacterium]|nr:tripartite tricarboxylate transporter TctB family protein [Anaerolineae bacterium]HOQ98055.1 tripartite tricarboxylate transporter TctB family protein [Anaerolineae bacterium]HPL29276.1 tripartite tricarboxylate transporter TctB family protein [Anaerolineae bacterium]
MKLKSDTWVLIAILAVTLFFGLQLFAYDSLKTTLVPAVACGLILVLGAVQLRGELIAGATAQAGDAAAKQTNTRYFVGFCWLVGYAIAVYLIGFMGGTFLFLLLFFGLSGKHTWLKSGLIAALGTAVFWLSFVYWLQTDLWSGIVVRWLNLSFPM